MKKIMSILTTAMLVVLTCINTLCAFATDAEWHVGDVNRDGAVNAVDASMVLSYYAKISTGADADIIEIAADVNHDGSINAVDASTILAMYAAEATGKHVDYEIIVVDKPAPKQFEVNDLIRFTGTSWFVHSTKDLLADNLYPNKNYIENSEVFVIAGKYENNWYGIYLNNIDTEVYILVSSDSMNYFEKIGKVEFVTTTTTTTTTTTKKPTTTTTTATTTTTKKPTTTTTTATTTTTKKPTTTTTNATTTTTKKPTTTTTTSKSTTMSLTSTTTTTITETTTTATVTVTAPIGTGFFPVDPNTTKYSTWNCVQFNGEWWNVRATPELGDNAIDHLSNGDIFFIKKEVGNYWYEIATVNATETGKYILIEPANDYLFQPAGTLGSCYFITDTGDVRTAKFLEDDSNIVGKLEFGDLLGIVFVYDDGWAKIITNKVDGKYKELYVLFQDMIRVM